jgi:hypothetical protein
LARRFFEELQAQAGPERVAVASSGPLAGPLGGPPIVEVSRHYFDLLRIPIIAGRGFDATDPTGDVVVTNEAAARRHLTEGYPVGHRLGEGWTFTGKRTEGLEEREIVGIARDARLTRGGLTRPVFFVPTLPGPDHVFLVGGPQASDLRAIADLVARLDPALHAEVSSGSEWLSRQARGRRVFVRVLGGFGALALFLAAVGLFSVGAYGVQLRRREIGIRMALGARRWDVIGTVFSSAGRAMLRGFLLGGLLAAGSAYAIRRLVGLDGVSPLDPTTYAGVVLALIAVAAIAVWLPARRAVGTAPIDVLRHD